MSLHLLRKLFVFGLLLFETWLLQDVSHDSTSSLVNRPITRMMILPMMILSDFSTASDNED